MDPGKNHQALCEQICHNFNNDELRCVCYAVGEVYEALDGRTCQQKAKALIGKLDAAGKLPDLIDECRLLRPNCLWREPD